MILLLIKLIIAYLGIYLLGSLIYKVFVTESYSKSKRIFIKMFFGLFMSVSTFAIIKTGGVTVNIISILLVFVLWAYNGFRINRDLKNLETEKEDLRYLLYSLPILLLFFSYRYYTIFNTSADIPVVINMDSLKHVIRAGFLVETGIESVNVNYIIPPTGVDPYHYFEAWTIGLIGSIFDINFWVAEQVVVFPMISTFIVIGFWGITERWSTRWYIYLIGIISVIYSGLYFDFILNIKYLNYTGGFAINAFDEWKGFAVSFAYLVVLLFLNLLFSNKRSANIVLVLLFLPIISITLAPSIFTLSVVLLLTLLLLKKKLKFNITWLHILIPFLIAFCIFMFYKIFEPTNTYLDKPDTISGLVKILNLSTLKSYAIIVFEKVIQTTVLFLPSILVALFLLLRERSRLKQFFYDHKRLTIISSLLFGFIISISFWIIFFGSFGSSQFFFYTMMPFFNIISLLGITYCIIKTQNSFLRIVIFAYIIIITISFSWRTHNIYVEGKERYFDKYSVEYINAVYNVLKKIDKPHGLKIEHPSEFEKFNDTHHLVGNFLPGAFNNSNLVSITLGEMYLNDNFPNKEAEMLIPKAPFSTYVESLKKENFNLDFESAVVSFINEYEIKFIFVSAKIEIPNYISSITKHTITDINTGEKLIILK